ncbi:alpha/beta fold hydrolase [Rhodanobacter sp. BL-MT-08]
MTILLSIVILLVVVIAALVVFSALIAAKVEKALPPRGRFIDIGADRIHYVEQGSGSPIVLVHGLSGQLLNFAYLDLQKLARSHRVIMIDRPGAGYSTRGENSPATIVNQAATVAAFIEALKLDKPLLVGHSLGGAIALAVGLNHPQSISRLALIAPLTHTQSEPPESFRGLMIPSPLMRRAIAHTLATPLSIRKGPEVLAFVFGPEPVPKDFRTRGGGLLGLRPNSFYAASSDMLATAEDLPNMESRYGTLKMPVDVLYGRQDQVLDYRQHGEALTRKIPHATLKLVDGGGHMLPVTVPALTTQWLLEIADSGV